MRGRMILPLHKGEGWGEGRWERSTSALTSPMIHRHMSIAMQPFITVKRLLLFFILIGCFIGDPVRAASVVVQANTPAEIIFTATTRPRDPFNEVTLDAVFTDPAGHTFRVPAFWDGGNIWKVRYSSPVVGRHDFRTERTPNDLGLNRLTGQVKITPYRGANPLSKH